MSRSAGFILLAFGLAGTSLCNAQGTNQLLPQNNETTINTEYTDAELGDYGFTASELTTYKARLNTKAGRWWGQLSPMEMMMYSATTEIERKRFARMYLESMHPKSLAERDATVTMYQVARDIHKEKSGLVQFPKQSKTVLKRPVLFVQLACVECKKDVIELVNASEEVLDIYIAGLNKSDNPKDQLVAWARSMRLPPTQITLNEDKGIYQRRYGKPLNRLHLVHQ